MKLVALVGSIRKDSLNLKLANSIQDRYRDKFELTIADIGSLPFYNQDNEFEPGVVVENFKKQVADSVGVIIITPEFNWSISGVLKNALDWLSRVDKVLVGKPVITAGVSPGVLGTVRAQLHLREILSAPGMGARVLPPGGNEILINMAGDKFDENGQLSDHATLTFLDDVIDKFLTFIKENNK